MGCLGAVSSVRIDDVALVGALDYWAFEEVCSGGNCSAVKFCEFIVVLGSAVKCSSVKCSKV